MPFFMWPPIVDGERNIFSPTTTNFSTIFNHFSAHILLHHTHLYVRRPQMNIFCCGWARARCWLRSLCECSCLCAFHIHNINFTLKTLFYRHSQRFSWFSLAHATMIWFPSNPFSSALHINCT